MPINYKLYPQDWKTRIRPAILERANNRCEICGAENGTEVWCESCVGSFDYSAIGYGAGRIMYGRMVKVVLTIAHLDHDRTNNDFSNLKALCQRCHLALDKEQHALNARLTRARKKREKERDAGQLELFPDIAEADK